MGMILASHAAFAAPDPSPTPDESQIPVLWPTTTGEDLFSESKMIAPGFAVYQGDSKLSDLFGTKGNSSLCWPTTMANAMAYYRLWSPDPNFNLPLVEDPLNGDYTLQVREFAKECKTNAETGTLVVDAEACLKAYLASSGIQNPFAYVVGPSAVDAPPGQPLRNFNRPITIQDIRSNIYWGTGVFLHADYYKYDANHKSWVYSTGHYVWVVGYDYDTSWGDDHILLKIVNPNVDYSSRAPNARWDNVTMMKIPHKPGVIYPQNQNYVLDGFGFKGIDTRGFVKNLFLFNANETR